MSAEEEALENGSFDEIEEVTEEFISEEVDEKLTECRVCLQNIPLESTSPLSAEVTSEDGDCTSLRDLFMQICEITIASEDPYPDLICDLCRDCLMNAYQLRLVAQRSDALLKERSSEATDETRKAKTIKKPIVFLEQDDGRTDRENLEEDDRIVEEILDERGSPVAQIKKINYRSYGRKFTTNPELERPFQCPVCLMRFHIDTTLKLHMMMHESSTAPGNKQEVEDIYHCDECESRFQTSEELEKHWKVHFREDQKPEDVVEYEYTEDTRNIRKPARIREKKRYACPHCPKIYLNLAAIAAHTKAVHPDKEALPCDRCPLLFPNADLLREHFEVIHLKKGSKNFPCSRCDKVFKSQTMLADHENVHDNNRNHLCNVCGKGYASRNALRIHVERHTNEKKFACDQCPSVFANKASLKHHSRIHTGEKPYQCPHCDSAFGTHFSWSKHKRTHTGEKPYVCDICGMRFNSSYHMNRHMRTHTGEKPYKCDYCERSFTQSNDLIKHKRSHLGKNVYQCNECSASFQLARELREHIAQHFLEKKSQGETIEEEIVQEVVEFSCI